MALICVIETFIYVSGAPIIFIGLVIARTIDKTVSLMHGIDK